MLGATAALAGSAVAAPQPSGFVERCLASLPAGPGGQGLALRQSGTPWGFLLHGSGRGFLPGEPLVTWVFDPTWDQPSCLDGGTAGAGGTGRVRAAFWSRASGPGRYTLCVAGAVSRRTACGAFDVRSDSGA